MGSGGRVNWVMLNPSTADECFDDPTIRKCVGFSKRWGFSSLIVTNLFAFRATDPKDLHALLKVDYPRAVGGGNDEAIANAANESDMVVIAWGSNAEKKPIPSRVSEVMRMFLRPSIIGLTKNGHPIHPCMATYTNEPMPYSPKAEVSVK